MPSDFDDEADTIPKRPSREPTASDLISTIRALQRKNNNLQADLDSEKIARAYDKNAHGRAMRDLQRAYDTDKRGWQLTNEALKLRIVNLEACAASLTAELELLGKAKAAAAARTIPAPDLIVTDIEEKDME